ncbi:MAG: 4-hydroxythreonine-4-phosphate dehydrogenase PdxA [Muribaculaceae bacterium]|nr:4-hydroxythreonine-4-phosphate dehydrogenase PdxA [Muribaculaceae bacterium]
MSEPVRVGITHGDINGISYEVILKAIAEEEITELFTPVVFGIPELVKKAIKEFNLPDLNFTIADDLSGIKDGMINIVPLKFHPEFHPGEIRKDAGKSAVEALEKAVKALLNQDIDVLVTAPISKEAVQSENFSFPGHTEFLSSRLGEGEEALMILCNDSLRVALLTVHLPITKVSESISKERIISTAEKFADTLKKDFGIVRPTIAVLSLNPHAGDGGLLGTEEEEVIKPAINELLEKGRLVFGPFPADGFFGHANYRNFDGVLAMYHDQGLAPFKTLASSGGVNFSAGLPYVRTSPDHGTAYDKAWKGEAEAVSMRDAIYMAIDIYRRRKTFEESASNPLKKQVHEKPERIDKPDRPHLGNEINQDPDD